MNNLTEVSRTALITLKSRVAESKKDKPVIIDPMGEVCLNRLEPGLPSEKYDSVVEREFPVALTRYIALRARKYDILTREFITQHPEGLVVSLGCGFDTRYWRVSDEPWSYVELDLPEVMDVKRAVMKDLLQYRIIDSSVLDFTWIDRVAGIQNKNVLFLAEGLLMYLPDNGARELFRRLSDQFSESFIIFEMVQKKYTKGIWKKLVEMKMSRSAASSAGSSYSFGIRKATEVEKFGNGIKILQEWSYFEDPDIKPRFLHYLRNCKMFTRTQWTIRASINTTHDL
ncbi:MAG: class I SAM-dependent methyltransferase [Bacteroidales bacterium]|nr:class I SAM-dependent methyltransferase [Bacteroidales bacterium]